jgi:hydrogenase maturation factor
MLRTGKLPPDLLSGLLGRLPKPDARVLVGPGIGKDAAVIDLGNGRVLVATSDPVTFATEDIGWYAVNVNANDIACMGAQPSWFMATLLLPPDTPEELPATIFDQTLAACDALGVALIGGHTEVTAGIDRPILGGTMLGEAARAEVVTGAGIAAGDAIVLAGSIAVEGTALLAKEAREELRRRGVNDKSISTAAGLLFDPGISVVAAAGLLCEATSPRLMHDATEGGLATALHEMAAAAGQTLVVDLRSVPVLAETERVCRALELDPCGLLASGALLGIISAADVERVTALDSRSAFRVIGRVEAGAPMVILEPEGAGARTPLPMFDRDELARFFDGMAGGR